VCLRLELDVWNSRRAIYVVWGFFFQRSQTDETTEDCCNEFGASGFMELF
jgi:hypothetical protein